MWLQLQIFGFRALWSPYFLTFLALIAIVYFFMTIVRKDKYLGDEKVTRNQQLFFYSGIILLYIVKGSPIDLLSHIMMSFHMLQTATLYFIVPIFLIRGIPTPWWEKIVELPVIKQIVQFFTKPLIALAVFNSLFAIYHLPLIFDFTKENQVVHTTTTIVLFITAIFMWWPIVTPIKRMNTLQPLVKMGYLLGSILMISIACALIILQGILYLMLIVLPVHGCKQCHYVFLVMF